MVNTYEVELRLTNPNTKEVSHSLRTEYAYSVIDAVQQAVFNQSASAGSAQIDVLHVGPPAEMVRLAAVQLSRAIEDAMASIKNRSKVK